MKPFTILRNEAGEGDGGGGTASGGGAQGGASLLEQGEAGSAQAQATQTLGGEGTQDGQGGASSFDFRSLIGDDGRFVSGYHEKLPENLREHAKHFQKYTDPIQALQHTLNLQQLLGQKANAVVIPDATAPREAWDPVLKKLGVPDSPDGYGLKAPDNLPEGVTVSPEELQGFATLAHEIGLTPQQVAKLQEYDLGRAGKSASSSAEQAAAIEAQELDKQREVLKKEWGTGQDADKKRALAERAALTFGFTPDEVKADPLFRNARFVMTLARAGAAMSEDSLASGENAGLGGGLKHKANDIINNPNNPLYKRYWDGDEEVNNQVRNWMRAG
jgi:hypothetical protein